MDARERTGSEPPVIALVGNKVAAAKCLFRNPWLLVLQRFEQWVDLVYADSATRQVLQASCLTSHTCVHSVHMHEQQGLSKELRLTITVDQQNS
eukprot:4062221-Amphidinium_carterae.1